jgi:hypothetical protein
MSQLQNLITSQVKETLKLAMQGSTLSVSEYYEEDIEKTLTTIYNYAIKAALYELLMQEDIDRMEVL